ncbi:hypothetical protein QYF61_023433 [Mycteria americana]|uniref:Uncharacterized protein n=1 Tax=Mycteria americana TaxID=33587 RepID=A0AAN7SA77_MYCAM|nr:hypothetical protein QYF61_023433 [Mycteria americana]
MLQNQIIINNYKYKPRRNAANAEYLRKLPYLGEQTNTHLATNSFQVVVESDKVSPQPPLLQTKQPQFPQPLLIRLVLQTLHQLRCPSLDTLQHLNVSLVVRGPKLNTVFKVRPHQCRVQGDNHFPTPAGHAVFDTSQDAVGFLGHLGTLLAHVQLAVNQHPQVLFCWAAFQPLFPKPVALHGVAVTGVQDTALGFVKPHAVDLSPSIQPVQIPLQSLPTLQQIDTPTQFGVICKLSEGTLNPLMQIIDKDINKTGPKTEPWGTLLVTGCLLDLTPFTTTLWAWPSSQFFTQRRVAEPLPKGLAYLSHNSHMQFPSSLQCLFYQRFLALLCHVMTNLSGSSVAKGGGCVWAVKKAAASGVGRKGETLPWGKGNEKVGQCLTGQGNRDWCPCRGKGCGNLECTGEWSGSMETAPLGLERDAQVGSVMHWKTWAQFAELFHTKFRIFRERCSTPKPFEQRFPNDGSCKEKASGEKEKAEQPQLSQPQPFLTGEVFHPSDHFCGPPLDPLQQLHVLLVLRAPELDAVLQVGSHQSRAEGQNHLPRPAGHASFDAAQDTVGLLGCECTLMAHVQLFTHQYPQVLLSRAALNPFIPQPVLIAGVAPTQKCVLG